MPTFAEGRKEWRGSLLLFMVRGSYTVAEDRCIKNESKASLKPVHRGSFACFLRTHSPNGRFTMHEEVS